MIETKKTTAPEASVGADVVQPSQKFNTNIIANEPAQINLQTTENEKKFALNTVSMSELYDTVYPPRKPIVDGLLYGGTYLFVGAPKVGKSFFMGQLAYHVAMIKNGKGGGNTKTGLIFEGETDLATFLSKQPSYSVDDGVVYYEGKKVARIFKKYGFYKFLAEKGVDWKKIISKRLLPDDSIYVIINNTLFIIECKYQQVNGSVDEKLQTCDFKRKEYQKLMAPLNIEVEYIYLLAEWFRNDKYKDVLDYIISVNCHYYFEYIPLAKLGLPVPPNDEEV